MTHSPNPYQASLPSGRVNDRESHAEIAFGGVITDADYAAMTPHRNLLKWLLAIITPTFFIVAFASSGAVLARHNPSARSFSFFAIMGFVLSTIPIGLYLLVSSPWLSKIRRQRPDLLGTVQGTMGTDGVLIDDGQRRHWFSACKVHGSKVLVSGVRLHITSDPRHYLALSTRLFDEFDAGRMTSMIHDWQRAAAAHPAVTVPTLVAERLGGQPSGAIAFSGQVQLQTPTDTPESRRQAWTLTIQMIIAFVIFLLTSISNPGGWSGLTLAMLIVTIFYGWAVFATWRLISRGTSLQTISQSGWISPTELLIEVTGSASRCPITCFQIQFIANQGVIWFVGEVGMVAITKDILDSSEDWQRLMDWFGK